MGNPCYPSACLRAVYFDTAAVNPPSILAASTLGIIHNCRVMHVAVSRLFPGVPV